MTTCPVFQVVNAAKTVSTELDQLLDDVITRLRRSDPRLFKDAAKAKDEWDDCLADEQLTWLEVGGAVSMPVSIHGKGHKVRRLSIRFDLNRDLPEETLPSWSHASDALIVIGYSSLKDYPWKNQYLAVAADGRLRDKEIWEACYENRHAGGRLLQYHEDGLDEGNSWAERPWLFAVPVRSLKDPESVDQHIIYPIVSLLANNKDAEAALAHTDAVIWAAN